MNDIAPIIIMTSEARLRPRREPNAELCDIVTDNDNLLTIPNMDRDINYQLKKFSSKTHLQSYVT